MIPADQAGEIRRWVIEGPAEQGLDRANWTYAELADHLLKSHGISVSRSGLPGRNLRSCERRPRRARWSS